VLTVKDGKQWQHAYRVMLVAKVTTEPQMAFWLEDTDGRFVATVYVTHRAATDDWTAAVGEDRSKLRRPWALPVWRHKHREGGVQPTATCVACHGRRRAEDKSAAGPPELDAITGATPTAAFTREWTIPAGVKPGVYMLKAEINQSRDFTDVYRANLRESDANWSGGKAGSGQPSLVWQATIDIGAGATSATLKRVGHGHPAGADGVIYPDLSTLTTALDIVESIKVNYVPGK
jgi:mono/diheme cytochrome c family protein